MTLYFLLGAILMGYWLCHRQHRRAGGIVYLLAAALFLLEGCGVIPVWMLGGLQSRFAAEPTIVWAPRNVIVLLGAGTARTADGTLEPALFAYGRIAKAAALYHACKHSGNDCKLEITGGDPQHHGDSEAHVYSVDLLELGADKADLLLETRSLSTWQNAQFSQPILQAYAPQKVVLVSSGIHLQRALLYFRHFGIAPTPVRGDYVEAKRSWLPLYWNFALTDLAAHEYVGVLQYRVYNLMGWNAAPVTPNPPASS